MRRRKALFVIGTRPEAIKLAPVILKFRQSEKLETIVCSTGQHRAMLDQVMNFFSIRADYDLDIMRPNQTLAGLTASILTALDPVLEKERPDYLIVQGDTTTAFAGALTAYYRQIQVVHVEAGLRSGDKYSPFPEEANRMMVSKITDYHFAPTERAKEMLAQEGITENVWMVGNSVIDALLIATKLLADSSEKYTVPELAGITGKRMILVTGHRRESFGDTFREICQALREIAELHSGDVEIIYPVHLNPNVQAPVKEILSGIPNIHLIPPVDYPQMVRLMQQSYLVLTDSGGVQEEAPTLGKPVLVMRDVTERTEGIEAGTALKVGTQRSVIVSETQRLLRDKAAYDLMAHAVNPYGDGNTSAKILEILEAHA